MYYNVEVSSDKEMEDLEDDVLPIFRRRVVRQISSESDDDDNDLYSRPHVNQRRKSIAYGPKGMFTGNTKKHIKSTALQKKENRETVEGTVNANEWLYNEEGEKPPAPKFEGIPGIRAPLDSVSSELDCFLHFFEHEQIKNLKTETNQYAAVIIAKLRRKQQLTPHSIHNKWTPVSLQEIRSFFAIFLHMSLYPKPELQDYWSTKLFTASAFPASIMSRNRFKSILSMLHLNDNSKYIPPGHANHDPLFKIRPFYDFLVERCRSSFYPEENLTVDEGICAFRGRLRFRSYIINKPERYGIKLYLLCDAKSGYVSNFEIYSSKGDNDNSVMSVLQRLLHGYLDKGHTMYMDRFYSSPSIFQYLWERNTVAVGTVQPNLREMPVGLKMAKLEKSEMAFARNGPLLAIRWKDSRDVYVLSTKHDATLEVTNVRSKDGLQEKLKPSAIADYNKNKTGVDRADQLLAYYPFKRKSLKWWKKLFFHLIIRAVVNAYILYKKCRNQNQNYRLKDFIAAVGTQLVENVVSEETVAYSSDIKRLAERHFIRKIPPTETNKHPARRCKVCADKGKAQTGMALRKETSYYCPQCDIALCLDTCFELYHTKEKYI